MVYRCDWCGRFYSSPLPEGSACDDHIPEHNERLRASIERFNRRLGVGLDRGGVSFPSVDDAERMSSPSAATSPATSATLAGLF